MLFSLATFSSCRFHKLLPPSYTFGECHKRCRPQRHLPQHALSHSDSCVMLSTCSPSIWPYLRYNSIFFIYSLQYHRYISAVILPTSSLFKNLYLDALYIETPVIHLILRQGLQFQPCSPLTRQKETFDFLAFFTREFMFFQISRNSGKMPKKLYGFSDFFSSFIILSVNFLAEFGQKSHFHPLLSPLPDTHFTKMTHGTHSKVIYEHIPGDSLPLISHSKKSILFFMPFSHFPIFRKISTSSD